MKLCPYPMLARMFHLKSNEVWDDDFGKTKDDFIGAGTVSCAPRESYLLKTYRSESTLSSR